MRDPLGLNERLFAAYYPRLAAAAENAGMRDVRRRLLAEASGRTLEIGAGSGLNLPHYTGAVSELVLTDPSPHMRDHLRRAIADDPPSAASCELLEASGEALPFDDASFDSVVCTYVLCTTPEPGRALSEVARVLRDGGRFLFLEHVHAGEGTLLGRVQDLVEIPHRYLAAGCYPNRRTERLLDASQLAVEWLEHGDQPRAVPTVRPYILGAALA